MLSTKNFSRIWSPNSRSACIVACPAPRVMSSPVTRVVSCPATRVMSCPVPCPVFFLWHVDDGSMEYAVISWLFIAIDSRNNKQEQMQKRGVVVVDCRKEMKTKKKITNENKARMDVWTNGNRLSICQSGTSYLFGMLRSYKSDLCRVCTALFHLS